MSTPPFQFPPPAVVIARGVQPPPFARSSQSYQSPTTMPVLPDSASASQPAGSTQAEVALACSESLSVAEEGVSASGSLPNYMVMVSCLATEVTAARTRGRPPVSKKTQLSRMSKDIYVDKLSRCELFNAVLALHELDDKYVAMKDRTPPFKMWFTGSSGGKASAPTILSDKDRDLVVSQLAASKKKPEEITVFISFDVDDLDAYRVRKRTRDDDMAGPIGTKVPRLGDMDPTTMLHGDFILMLKAQHKCEEHCGEHGEPGHCYVWPNGQHLGLNNRRLAMWSAAMAAGEATRHAPPNVPEFDGPQGSGIVTVKHRGRVTAAPPVPPSSISASDATSVLIAAMVPLLTSLTQSVFQKSTTSPTVTTTSDAPAPPPNPPSGPPSTSTSPPVHNHDGPCLDIPFMFSHDHTCDCIAGFKAESGIDLSEKLDGLKHRELTPDLLLEVPHDHLSRLFGISEGKTIMFQIYCRRWVHNFKAALLAEWEAE
ncbi:hypothetical protein RhiJN_12360 [Ceratobasidium sp. AG-Ba]|nr:hypothetical protein RhiJN_06763 [Ceratobasidium sp. AG-Ba]QRV82249.1 hypothetical protein RhiJN_10264 [Ceratobasidium sp. AG-Ba]QRV84344.1 hypothetical protein RhiJN_12360 [Ceratobasidium sp. AG-Ba]QRW07678.1 hypothetical protein RhiLY_06677 [Ceratobasidium sp. AG-Ba]QRW11018.1 hypothetical protein RhiLY_10017 [Ceratobasidium sp. AG-Ba]